MWRDYGSLCKYSNQGTESSNHFHRVIGEVMGSGALGSTQVDVLKYFVRVLLYQIPKRKKEISEFIQNKYKAWKINTNKSEYKETKKKNSANKIALRNTENTE